MRFIEKLNWLGKPATDSPPKQSPPSAYPVASPRRVTCFVLAMACLSNRWLALSVGSSHAVQCLCYAAAAVSLASPTPTVESVARSDNIIHTTRQKPLSRSCLTYFSSFPMDALPLVVVVVVIVVTVGAAIWTHSVCTPHAVLRESEIRFRHSEYSQPLAGCTPESDVCGRL